MGLFLDICNKSFICIDEICLISLINHERVDALDMNGVTTFLGPNLELEYTTCVFGIKTEVHYCEFRMGNVNEIHYLCNIRKREITYYTVFLVLVDSTHYPVYLNLVDQISYLCI